MMVTMLVEFASEGLQGARRHTEPDERGPCCDHNNRSFCDGLDPDAREKLKAISRAQSFPRHARIAEEGDETTPVGNVVSGVLKLTKTLPDGRQQIVGLLLSTDMFGYAFGRNSGFSIEAATDVTLCTFERSRFETLLREAPSLEREVATAIAGEFETAREWAVLMSGRTVAARLAGFLLILCNRWPRMACKFATDHRCIQISVPIDRKDLAQYLGTTVESLSRTVQEFAKAGVLRVLSSSRFDVLDAGALIDTAGMPEFTTSFLSEQLRDQG